MCPHLITAPYTLHHQGGQTAGHGKLSGIELGLARFQKSSPEIECFSAVEKHKSKSTRCSNATKIQKHASQSQPSFSEGRNTENIESQDLSRMIQNSPIVDSEPPI